ncbi:hypothetical protein BU068_12500 [Staphylococcus succinus]|uniref:hypothetical protein n=1 Tax=Staphylococcus succinus TaxID=61015 RepID=UPI000E69F752|nr:hypothetical protein [Staphylococcus succinus]RIN29288.1 hypothetical protein BU068_12500 [Staphylococcus succinus]
MFKKLSFSIIAFTLTFSLFISFTADAKNDENELLLNRPPWNKVTNTKEYTSKLGYDLSDEDIKIVGFNLYAKEALTVIDFKNKKYVTLYATDDKVTRHQEVEKPGEGPRYNERIGNMNEVLNKIGLPNYNINYENLRFDSIGPYYEVIDFDKKIYYQIRTKDDGGVSDFFMFQL